jgi:hypothetical protein
MRPIVKYVTSLLLAISMAVTPVISVLATTVTDNAAHTQDTNVMPCHEKDSEHVVKDESTQVSGTHICNERCKDGACQEKLCSSCAHLVQLSTPSLTFYMPQGISDSYQSNLFDSYPSLILSPAFRPPIS